jgi:hypothetical protein
MVISFIGVAARWALWRVFSRVPMGLLSNGEMTMAKFGYKPGTDGGISSRGERIPVDKVIGSLIPVVASTQIFNRGRGQLVGHHLDDRSRAGQGGRTGAFSEMSKSRTKCPIRRVVPRMGKKSPISAWK